MLPLIDGRKPTIEPCRITGFRIVAADRLPFMYLDGKGRWVPTYSDQWECWPTEADAIAFLRSLALPDADDSPIRKADAPPAASVVPNAYPGETFAERAKRFYPGSGERPCVPVRPVMHPASSPPALQETELTDAAAEQLMAVLHSPSKSTVVPADLPAASSPSGLDDLAADIRASDYRNFGAEELAEQLVARGWTQAVPCPKCGQIAADQTGEYPCPVCNLPTVHDDAPPSGLLELPTTPGVWEREGVQWFIVFGIFEGDSEDDYQMTGGHFVDEDEKSQFRNAYHIPRGGWANAVPAAELEAVKSRETIERLERELGEAKSKVLIAIGGGATADNLPDAIGLLEAKVASIARLERKVAVAYDAKLTTAESESAQHLNWYQSIQTNYAKMEQRAESAEAELEKLRPKVFWTKEKVAELFADQQNNQRHPFTCGNRSDHPVVMGDKGVLIPTIYGWICPFCDYRQNLSHEPGGAK